MNAPQESGRGTFLGIEVLRAVMEAHSPANIALPRGSGGDLLCYVIYNGTEYVGKYKRREVRGIARGIESTGLAPEDDILNKGTIYRNC